MTTTEGTEDTEDGRKESLSGNDDPPTVFVCDPTWQTHLTDELQRANADLTIESFAPGWIVCRGIPADSNLPAIALAQQVLPTAELLPTPSISKAASAVSERLIDCLAKRDGPWRLHVFTPDQHDSTASPRRCELIAEAIEKQLAKRQRRLRRSRVVDDHQPWQTDEWLVQLGLVSADQAWLSIVDAEKRPRWEPTMSRFAGGVVDAGHDLNAPSRAHGKIVEAEHHLNQRIEAGQTCVDLGASPGGWTYHAVERGAQVTAVDRSPLRDDLMQHRLVSFVKGDAFRFEPEAPVDWLICDVIATPDKTFSLLQTWLERRWCRQFCVTVKFRGDEHYALLDDFKRLLAEHCSQWHLRRLAYNKNEVTAIGTVAYASSVW